MRPFGFKDKIGYLFGDFANDFFFVLVSSYLLVFYTDVFKLSPAAVGGMFVIARLWDAFADVAWGRIADASKRGKNGKFKPWLFRMSVPVVISGILMFVHIPGMSQGFYIVYAYVTYILWGTLYSSVNIPYGSMASVISSDPVERTSLSGWRGIGATLAGLIVGTSAPLILFVNNKADANHFLMGAILFGVLAIACYIACYKLTVERVVIDETMKPKANIFKTLKGLARNRPFIAFFTGSLVFLISLMLIGAVNAYLFKNYFSNAKALSIVSLVGSAGAFIGMPLVKPLVSKFGKKEVASGALLLTAVDYFVLYLLPNISAMQYIGILSVGMFGYGLFNLIIWAFVTDIVDYHEYLTGLREDGTVYSFYTFGRKIGQAVAGGVGGAAIAAVGYNPTLQVQTHSTLNGIHSLATLVPSILFLLVFVIVVLGYPLNKKRTQELANNLTEKKNSVA